MVQKLEKRVIHFPIFIGFGQSMSEIPPMNTVFFVKHMTNAPGIDNQANPCATYGVLVRC